LKFWLRLENVVADLSGVIAVLSSDRKFLVRLENSKGKNLTPWIRRRDAVAIELPIKFLNLEPGATEISRSDFSRLLEKIKEARYHAYAHIRIHKVGTEFALHSEISGQLSGALFSNWSDLKPVLKKIRRASTGLDVTLIGQNLELFKKLREIRERMKIRFIADGFRIHMALPPLRSVLVFTNLVGEELPFLNERLDFWSRGVSGFRFRHIFGQLNRRRVEEALIAKQWDILIYRGHGAVADSRIAWQLSDELFAVPAHVVQLYFHSACLAEAENLDLKLLPAERVLMPLTYLTDFSDHEVVDLLLHRYRASLQLDAALRSVQNQFPQFASVQA